MATQVVLVDGSNRRTGVVDKMEAHRQGVLHRAVSVVLFNRRRDVLIQRRAQSKYHCGDRWSNTACTHPMPGERAYSAALRCLRHELGVVSCDLKTAGCFVYKCLVTDGLVEHEHDQLFFGRYDGSVRPNPDEVAEYRWITLADLQRDILARPALYTEWFRIMMCGGLLSGVMADPWMSQPSGAVVGAEESLCRHHQRG